VILNLISVCMVAYITVTVAVRYFAPETQQNDAAASRLRLGQPVPLDGVDWTKTSRTLVMVLSTSCSFCRDSAPFYRALLTRQPPGSWRPIAVLPQSRTGAQSYMRAHGLEMAELHQVRLDALGVFATPALLLVDRQGKLQQQWIGKLTHGEENDVAEHLGVGTLPARQTEANLQSPPDEAEIALLNRAELRALLAAPGTFNLVDVRQRPSYRVSHITGSLNIPVDELFVRAPHELIAGLPTVVYCSFSPACQASGIPSYCSLASEQLKDLNMTRIRVIRDPLQLLIEGGIPVTADAPVQRLGRVY
jgi:hypothetical protein